MALEITGLGVGTVALVGVFKDCIDVYGMIVAARSLNDDAEVLNTKLDVERMLLLQWADRIGMTQPEHYDRRLDDPDLNRTIARVLRSIKRLLSDGKALRDRYGLIDYQEVRHDLVLDDTLEISNCNAGYTRLQQFIERFNKLSLHTGVRRKDHSVSTRFKWVVKDKEQFAGLMNELSYFVARLNELIPGQEQSGKTMTENDLSQIRTISQLKMVIKASTGFRPQIALIAQGLIQRLNQKRVLECLWFRWIDDRKTSIKDRHFRTLKWALEPPERTGKWGNLAEWLRNDSGIYWLAGKAGSGKSTLMKYLSDNPQVIDLLKEWSAQPELVTLQFFFYALGSPEQKSQEGILRSLLHQFLDKYPDLIEHVVPAMWKEAIITEDSDLPLTMPSISEMQQSFLRLVGAVSADKKFWILIDGLDEFKGKHATIAAFLSSLERLPNVKVLVSSRPLPVFMSAFDHTPKMYLQDLTKQDIQAYIDDTILRHPLMKQITHIERDVPEKIAQILISKASGVFLWVVLACRSILEGLEDYETVPELMSRITELAPELDDFFRRIIAGWDPRKREQSARLLRLVFESQKGPGSIYIPAMGLAIVDEQGLRADFTGPSVTDFDKEKLRLLYQILEGRLRSRCSGLLELQGYTGSGDSAENLPDTYGDPLAARVEFMHRSLYEFLCTEGIWEWDVLHVDNKYGIFEPHVILASLWIQLGGLQSWRDITFHNTCFENALVHIAHAGATNCPPSLLATTFSRLQGFFAEQDYEIYWDLARLCLSHQPKCRKGYEGLSGGLALAAELDLVGLVQFSLENPDELRRTSLIQPAAHHVQDCSSFSTCPTELYRLNRDPAGPRRKNRSTVFPLLYYATCQPFTTLLQRRWGSQNIIASINVVKYLLQEGHNPNEAFFTHADGLHTTSWIEWLDLIRPEGSNFISNDSSILKESESSVKLVHQRAAVTLLFVDAGAKLGTPGSQMCNMVDESVSSFISNAVQRSGRVSVQVAESDALWLKVRDRVQSLRTAASQQDVQSRWIPTRILG